MNYPNQNSLKDWTQTLCSVLGLLIVLYMCIHKLGIDEMERQRKKEYLESLTYRIFEPDNSY